MSDKEIKHCSFCGIEQSASVPLIAGSEGYICGACVSLANQVVTSWSRKKELSEMQGALPIPAKIKEHLDRTLSASILPKKYWRLPCITITSGSSMKAAMRAWASSTRMWKSASPTSC